MDRVGLTKQKKTTRECSLRHAIAHQRGMRVNGAAISGTVMCMRSGNFFLHLTIMHDDMT